MAGVIEHEWLQKKCDVKRCMKVGRVSDTVIAGLLPQFFVKVERLVGDGGAGTVKLTTLNPGKTRAAMIESLSFNFSLDRLVYIIVSTIGSRMFGLTNLWDVGFACRSCHWW